MALEAGKTLGPYEIQSPLGAGGMGEVYRALDTRLGRTVAVKILPAHLSQNVEARQRFEREARSISALNHPHICTLYDIGTDNGTSFLVMEHVQGETLEARLQKGALPMKQVTEMGIQICDALEKAHRAGIVHRDLKPGNIMLTASGAKLLDFGLAKAVGVLGATAAAGAHTPDTPTMNVSALRASAAGLTQQGTIVGTFQYMAPEAAEGLPTDARSDIFSVGCVLYEMLTGRRAFEGKSQLSVLTAILEKEPEPISTLQPLLPQALEYTVHTCLEKNPDQRFQTAHDVKLQLAWIARSGSQAGAIAVPARKQARRSIVVAALAGAIVSALLVAGWTLLRQPSSTTLRTYLLPPEAGVFETLYRNGAPALSPDGKRVAFVAKVDGKNALYVRSLDNLTATPLRGTEDAFFPFWSPDGQSVAFFMRGKLWKVEVNGGAPMPICDALEPRGGSWGSRNMIVFAPNIVGAIAAVSAEGGAPRSVSKLEAVFAESDRWPVMLPDGKHFLYIHSPQGDAEDRNQIRFASIDGGSDELVSQGRYYTVQYAAGWLLAVRDGALLAWKFNPSSGKSSSDPVQLLAKVATDEITALAVFSVSQSGFLLYQLGTSSAGDRHIWVDSTGKLLSQFSEPAVYGPSRLSPDGTRLATPKFESNDDMEVWVWSLVGNTRSRIASSQVAGSIGTPVWSADGRSVFYDWFDGKNPAQLRRSFLDGSQDSPTLLTSTSSLIAPSLQPDESTPDGKWLLYEEESSTFDGQLKALPLPAGGQPLTVLDSVSFPSNARLSPASPDWLAYQAKNNGRSEIYLTRFPHPGAKYQVSQNGGTQAVWSKDGKKIYFLDPSQHLTSVDVAIHGDDVEIGDAKTLFSTGIRHSIPNSGYDVARDGRFLIVDSVTESTAPVVLVSNWESELKK